jgi:hypothetical protein
MYLIERPSLRDTLRCIHVRERLNL